MATSLGTSLGRRLGTKLGYGLTTLEAILILAAGRPVFTEREYTVVAGTVVDIFDLSDQTRTHVVTQADPAKQVLPPAMHADFLRPCYHFTGAQWYDSNRSIAYWQYMHNGTGSGCYYTCTPTDIASTRFVAMNRGNANRGFSTAFFSTPTVAGNILIGAGSIITVSQAATVNVPVQVGFNYLEGGATPQEYALKSTGLAETTGDSGGAPEALNSLTTMRLGARGVSNDFQFRGRLTAIAFPGALTAAQRSSMREALTALYGVAA